jgi:replicative DNA helicase
MTTNPSFFDSDSERAVLGAALLDNACIETLRPILLSDDFYTQSHRVLWDICLELSQNRGDNKNPVDIITVNNAARSLGADIDAAYIAGLSSATPSSANVEHYANIVKKQSMRRQLYLANREAAQKLKDGTSEPADIAGELSKRSGDISVSSCNRHYVSIGSLIPGTIKQIEYYNKHSGELMGCSLGLDSIDDITMGARQEDYIVIGARPSVGKTSLMMTMANRIAIDKNISTGIFSAEMSKEAINERQVCTFAKVSSRRMRMGHISPSQFQRLQDSCAKIYSAPMYIDDTPNISLSQFRASARRMIYEHGVKIIFIDYLTLINAEKPKMPRWEQISYISREIKCFCREAKIPIVALSQLKREAEGKRPNLSDLRESGAIEQDADIIFFLHRPKEPDINAEIIETELICSKQRNGPIGVINLNFIPEYTTFEDKPEAER